MRWLARCTLGSCGRASTRTCSCATSSTRRATRCAPAICCSTSSRRCRLRSERTRSSRPSCAEWGRRSDRLLDLRVALELHPEIQEAIRTERPVIIHDVRDHPLFETIRKRWVQQQLEVNVQAAVALPVFVQGRAAGVFFLRTVQGDPQLRTQDVAFANTIAQ